MNKFRPRKKWCVDCGEYKFVLGRYGKVCISCTDKNKVLGSEKMANTKKGMTYNTVRRENGVC